MKLRPRTAPAKSSQTLIVTLAVRVVVTIADNVQTNIVNLIRGSYRSDPASFSGVSSMASAINSSTDPSYDGRVVSLASWNAY